MKTPWKSSAETSRQSLVHQPSTTRKRSDIRSMKDRISGPITIATPIDAAIPMANTTQDSSAGHDTPSTYDGNSDKPATPDGTTVQDQRDTNNVRAPRVSPQHAKVVRHQGDDGPSAEDGDAPNSRIVTPSGGPHVRQPGKNIRMSYFSTDSTNNGNKEPQKKKSALRGAIGRLFGRKKKAISQASTWGTGSTQPTPEPRHAQAEVAQGNTSDEVEKPRPEHKRSVSMPVSEKDRALRSHSIGLKDRFAIESARNSLRPESNFSRRRPGTQSLRRSNRRSEELSGLTPRPRSTSERISGVTPHIDDPKDIGRALSSDDVELHLKTLQRRSRSLTALTFINPEQTVDRRRSGEIRYWRASYDPEYKSPLSSAHPEQDEEDNVAEEDKNYSTEAPRAPLEPFNFQGAGLASMKITTAASLETRISRLEDRTNYLTEQFEGVDRFLKDLRAEQMSLGSLEPMDKFLGSRTPRSQARAQRSEDATGDTSAVQSSRASQGLAPEAASLPSTRKSSSEVSPVPEVPSLFTPIRNKANRRPDSSITVKAASASSPRSSSLAAPDIMTIDHYTTLIALLDTERSARMALEEKVKTLDYQVSIMRSQSSQDHDTNGIDNSNTCFGGSAFDEDSEDSDGDWFRKKSGAYQDEDDSAAYATPNEPDTTDDEAIAYKKSDRTMSLSQMTMQGHKKIGKSIVPRSLVSGKGEDSC